ncbi:MAG: Ig-like domain-containing protein [Clostridia bacterium]|nr:Ig-like domain-containing protein [Clostridia bacterium]
MRMKKGLATLLSALLLLTLLPTALMESTDVAPQLEEIEGAQEDAILEEDWQIEPEVGLADDAGDTGLTIEYEDAPIEDVALAEEPVAEDGEPSDEAVEAPDALLDEAGGVEILALPVVSAGYVAVAPEAPVYADAARTQAVGVFPEGAAVYAESVENGGALLKIRFDTEDSRGWDQEILTGYVLAEDALAYTEAEAEALTRTLAADARTRYLDGVAIPCVGFTAVNFAVMAGETGVGLGVTAHTQADIQKFVNAHPSYRNQLNIYSVAASDAPYAPGKLSAVNQQSALNMVNQIRYIAGLSADIAPLTGQEDAMASTALVLRLYSEQYKAQNGKDILTHYPGRAAAISDAGYDSLYSQGYTGAGRSNIAMGYTVTSSLLAYMSDADDANIKTVGHRRWILNPTMGKTIFGANGRFSAMYAHDLSGAGGQTKVAWPAQEMPLQYFSASDPWSVSYGRELTADKVSVSLVRVRDGKTWSFSSAKSDGDFTVENSAYGQKGCVIFRPSGLDSFAEGETFNVSITDGASGELTRYTVHFFNLDLSAANPLDTLTNVTALKTRSGNEISWSAVSGAQGYYVCRRASASSYYQIVADVTGTSYKDAAVFEDQDYYYQVYAHNASITSRSAVAVEARPVSPDSVTLSASGTVKLYRNATLQLTVNYAPSNAMAKLTWKSSKTKIAKVDADGLVTPLKKGSTIISVTTDNGKSASVKIKVVSPPKAKKVILSASGTLVLNVGDTLQLSGTVEPAEAEQKVSWRTNKKKVASVSGTGMVTALRAGTATITAKSAGGGKKAKVKIKVVDPYAPDSVALNYKGTVTLKVGDTLKLDATVLPATAQTTLKWSTSHKRVAAVAADGVVTALKRGKATITVRTANGKKARLKIKVVQ